MLPQLERVTLTFMSWLDNYTQQKISDRTGELNVALQSFRDKTDYNGDIYIQVIPYATRLLPTLHLDIMHSFQEVFKGQAGINVLPLAMEVIREDEIVWD